MVNVNAVEAAMLRLLSDGPVQERDGRTRAGRTLHALHQKGLARIHIWQRRGAQSYAITDAGRAALASMETK